MGAYTLKENQQDINSENIFKNLGKDNVLIDFITFQQVDLKDRKPIKEQLVAVVVSPSNKPKIKLVSLGETASIEKSVFEVRRLISNPVSSQMEFRELQRKLKRTYSLIWKPIFPYIKDKQKVYLIPDGSLHILPFSALLSPDNKFLIETTNFIILTSGRDLIFKQNKSKKSAPAIFSAPYYDPSQKKLVVAYKEKNSKINARSLDNLYFNYLPGTNKEGKLIAEILKRKGIPTNHYAGELATESNLKKLISPQFLHLSTHGFFLGEYTGQSKTEGTERGIKLQQKQAANMTKISNPLLQSGLAFVGANEGINGKYQKDGSDGIFTALEALGLDLIGTDLVVLSACETGVGKIKAGEGVYGLRRAFLEAGAQNVMSTLWKVDDKGTMKFMNDFYMFFLKNKFSQEALRKVQLKFIKSKDFSHPYFWAPFVMVGKD